MFIRDRLLIETSEYVGFTYTSLGEGARAEGCAIIEYNFADVQNMSKKSKTSRPTGKVRTS